MYLVLFYNYYEGDDLHENNMARLFESKTNAEDYANMLNNEYMESLNLKTTDELLSYYYVIYIPKG